jgi:hypothetical protein
MKSIDHLPEEEKQHYVLCECGEHVDMRDLSEVFYHESGDCLADKPKIDIPFSSARRMGKTQEYLNNSKKTEIDLN